MKDYMTIEELTDYLQVSQRTLYNWRKMGLKTIKVNKVTFFKAETVREFLDRHEVCDYARQ